MQKIKNLFSNTLTLILILVLGLIVTLFFSNQTRQFVTQQRPEATTDSGTPASTRIPTVIPVVVTIFPTPTQAPTPTPTPTFEPLSDKPIMGFVFKPPQEIPNTRNSVGYYEIIEWLPDSSEEVLVKGPLTLETVNALSGTVKQYAEVESPGNIFQPIWLFEAEGVAYLAADIQANKTNLWLGKAGSKPEILLSDVGSPLIPMERGRGVAVYDKSEKGMKAVSPSKQNLKPAPQPATAPFPQMTPGKLLNTAYQPGGDWIAYYNVDGFRLVNSKTGEVRLVDLGERENEPLWAFDAKWSPDGQKLALIITRDRATFDFTDLYILEWPTATLHKVDDTFTFVSDIAWAPDSKHLLLKAVIDQKDGFNIFALYITNVSTSSDIVPVPIPIKGLAGFGDSLSWSPDGKTVLVQYFDGQEAALYRIDVTAP